VTSLTLARWLTSHKTFTPSEILRLIRERHSPWAYLLVPAIYAGCIVAFIADLLSTNTVAFGVFYAPLVVTAVFHRDQRAVWVLAAIACVMVIVGSFFPVVAYDVPGLLENRALSICAVLATAAFVRHARSIQDQLVGQTIRAEAAERIKTEVLDNLSQEIRAPLYSMIGVLELVAADGRGEHKAALGMVRDAGRRLVTTVDNLVDLTQFEERTITVEAFDLGMLLRQTAEASRHAAAVRQIGLTINIPQDNTPSVGIPFGNVQSGNVQSGNDQSGDMPSDPTPPGTILSGHELSGRHAVVDANPWAARRILENLIADAITYTAPGGRVEVSIISARDHVAAVVTDTGTRPPGTPQSANDPNLARLMPSVMGLALSQRLARAMNARLIFSSAPDQGTTARLLLPYATLPPA
jgi:signal transduction histidine kinase